MASPHPAPLRRARRALGSFVAVADFLGVTPAELAQAGDPLPDAWRRKLDALVEVDERLRRLAPGRMPPGWLRTPHPALDGATPEDVLAVDGAPRVLDAIEREFG